MATRKGATKTVGGKRYRYNGTKWVQINAKGNVTPTSSSNRSKRSRSSSANVTNDSNRQSRGGTRTTTDTQRTSTGSAKVTTKPKALPPGQRGGALSTGNRARRTNINTNPASNATGATPKLTPKGTPKVPPRGTPTPTPRALPAGTKGGAIVPSRNPGVRGGGGLLSALGVGEVIGGLMTEFLPRTPTPSNRGTGRASDNVKPGPSNRQARQQAAGKPSTTKPTTSKPTTSKPTTTKPTTSGRGAGRASDRVSPQQRSNKPNNAAEINARLKQQRAEKNRALKATTTPPKPTPPKDTSKPDPRASTAPPRPRSGGSGGGRSTPAPIPKKTSANDPSNAAYIAARSKLNSKSTKAERDKVRDMGMDIHNKTFGKKTTPKKTKPTKSKPTSSSSAQNLRTGRSPDPIPKKKKKKKEVLPYFGGNGIGRY